jgi:alpha-tubulin suppressor-like RCC1 family protein
MFPRSSLAPMICSCALALACSSPTSGGDAGSAPRDAIAPAIDAPVTPGTDSAMPFDGGGTPTGPALVSLAAGASTTCAVLDDGSARCWGDNRAGQLGDGTTTSSVRPVAVAGLDDALSISTGYEHSCAVRSAGTVVCWGSGTNGKLGNGATSGSPTPVAVTGLTDVVQVRAGFTTTCALRGDGTVWCWGRGGELGSDALAESSVPVQVPGLADVVALAAASHGGTSLSSHTCGVRSDGTAFCWGLNSDGQNGTGDQATTRSPAAVSGVDDATAITAGMTHACAARASGTSCWGASTLIGDGTVERRLVPTAVSSDAAFVELTAGFEHTCGRSSGGDVWCWGRNGSGQIGDGEPLVSGDQRLVPVQADVTNVALIAAGMSHTCAHTTDGATYCWGRNEYGETGSGTPGSSMRSNVPALVEW